MEIGPLDVHKRAFVIDGACPLLRKPQYLDWYKEGGCTAVAPTVGLGLDAGGALREIGGWLRLIQSREDLILIRSGADIERAKREDKLGILMHFQGTQPIENDLRLVDAYKALGVSMIMLTYNQKNMVGDGCEERTDAGLSNFGVELVQRLNEQRIIVDVSHTGTQTTLDAIKHSTRPVVFSHSNVRAVHDVRRNISDEQIKAVAASGGLVGMNAFPPTVVEKRPPSMDDFLRHFEHVHNLVGPDHIGLGLDYFTAQSGVVSDAEAKAYYDESLRVGRWRAEMYPPPPYVYPEGIETPRTLWNLTKGLIERGLPATDVSKIMGGNWYRVVNEVLGSGELST
jgi:membrane dipeptidase